jgi:hypothetical protein
MIPKNRLRPAALLACLCVAAAGAQSLDATSFRYAPGPLGIIHGAPGFEAPVIGWNVNDKRMMAPGMKVIFWGEARGCGSAVRNGPVAESAAFAPGRLQELVGLAAQPGQHLYSPSGRSGECPAQVQDAQGPTFALIDENPGSGGIALYTQAASPGAGSADFFGPYVKDSSEGQVVHGGGNDKNEGAFITFRLDWRGAGQQAVAPWGGGDVHGSGSAFIRSVQGVQVLDLGAGAARPAEKAFTQAKQELVVTFINRACAAQEKTPSKPCQVQYVFNVAVARSTVADWSRFRRGNAARLTFDKKQGGLPFFFGPVKAAGEATEYEDEAGLALWLSHCAASEHGPVREMHTCVEIRRQDLLNALRIATGKLEGTATGSVSDAQIAGRFGQHWNDMGEWHLAVVSFGQEVYNSTDSATARIGGNLRSLEIGSGN